MRVFKYEETKLVNTAFEVWKEKRGLCLGQMEIHVSKLTMEEYEKWQSWDEWPERADNPPPTVETPFWYKNQEYW